MEEGGSSTTPPPPTAGAPRQTTWKVEKVCWGEEHAGRHACAPPGQRSPRQWAQHAEMP